MGKQHPFYRVKRIEINQQFIQKLIKYLYFFQYQIDKNLHLYMDIFYINGLIFLHTKTEKTISSW